MKIDFSRNPPFTALFITNTVDGVCEHLGCAKWRHYVPSVWTQPGRWMSPEFRIEHHLRHYLPPLLSYQDFLKETGFTQGFQSLKVWMFETPSTSLADLTTPSAMILLIVLVVIFREIKRVLQPYFSDIGRKAAIQTHGKEWVKENDIKIEKFGEFCFRLLYHIFSSALGLYLFADKEWWQPGGTGAVFVEWPNQPISPQMAWYYLIQCANFVDCLITLFEISFTYKFPFQFGWSDRCRGDFREMAIHHFVTNFLIFFSSYFRFSRIGSMVFMVHDIPDIAVDVCKLANFLKWKNATAVCFVTMVVTWFIFRICVLPFKIFHSILHHSWQCCATDISLQYEKDCPLMWDIYRPIFLAFIAVLIALHVFWFVTFLKMGYILVAKGETHDLTEHKKGETDELDTSDTSSEDMKKSQ